MVGGKVFGVDSGKCDYDNVASWIVTRSSSKMIDNICAELEEHTLQHTMKSTSVKRCPSIINTYLIFSLSPLAAAFLNSTSSGVDDSSCFTLLPLLLSPALPFPHPLPLLPRPVLLAVLLLLHLPLVGVPALLLLLFVF